MKYIRSIAGVLFVTLIGTMIATAQTGVCSPTPCWDSVNIPSGGPLGIYDHLLLMDGTVLAQESGVNYPTQWWRLTPDITGNYENGTWTQAASLPPFFGYCPNLYSSAVLPDGRVLIEGGEENTCGGDFSNFGAIYDPVLNVWTQVSAPSGWSHIGDAENVVLSDGTFMMGSCCIPEAALFNATTLTWTSTGTGKMDDNYDEEGFTLLPSGNVLDVDILPVPGYPNNSEIYNPGSGSWSSGGNTQVQLYGTAPSCTYAEIGPAMLLPNGTVLAMGVSTSTAAPFAPGHTSIYNPTSGIWIQGPDFPSGNCAGGGTEGLAPEDMSSVLLPNGNVLVSLRDPPCACTLSTYPWVEFDGTSFNLVPSLPDPTLSFPTPVLLLPTGQVLASGSNGKADFYNPSGSPNPSWAPTIVTYPFSVTHATTGYTISGTQFNGLSQAMQEGDDLQAATNYPIVRIINTATQHVFYCRAYNPSTMAVATESAVVSVTFDVPSGVETGASQIQVVANGIASTARNIIVH